MLRVVRDCSDEDSQAVFRQQSRGTLVAAALIVLRVFPGSPEDLGPIGHGIRRASTIAKKLYT